ncbi:MAG: hypothetical protein ACE5FU_02250 [Nitrospinota bacterium]
MLRVQRDHTTAKRLKRILELVPTRRSETFCG